MARMTENKKTGLWFHLFDVGLNIAVILAVVGLIRTFLISPFQVEGSSMLSTLEHNEYIIINKLAYNLGKPERGDVVVFRPPTDKSKYYVKRVIGVPGDVIIIRDGSVHLRIAGSDEEVRLNEAYLNEGNQGKTFKHPPSSGNTEQTVYEVPADEYFLLGDNRQGSLDSRSFMTRGGEPEPFVSREDIKGRVWFVALPVTKIHALSPPVYGL